MNKLFQIILICLLPYQLFADYGFTCNLSSSKQSAITTKWFWATFFIDDDMKYIGIIFSNNNENEIVHLKKSLNFGNEEIEEVFEDEFSDLDERSKLLKFEVSRKGNYIKIEILLNKLVFDDKCFDLSKKELTKILKVIKKSKIENSNKLELLNREKQEKDNKPNQF